MKEEDFDAIVRIDEKVLKINRSDYDRMKFDKFFRSNVYLPTLLVAVKADGAVAGFIMEELFIGKYGIF